MTILLLQASLALATPGLTLTTSSVEGPGLNVNRIVDAVIHVDYVAVCFNGRGEALADEHLAGDRPAGSNCAPGDYGFVITSEEYRNTYFEALAHCRRLGMRTATGEELVQLRYLAEHGGPVLPLDPEALASWRPLVFTDNLYVPTLNNDVGNAAGARGFRCAR